ncbi:hypothetical protein ABZ912_28345 [Nonomuraea angiospora]|uniref:hypothetical protein n=1 Tax=Nonomuraea angiospora TaxID=46172 RepID=UPI0033D244D4
MPLRVPEIDRRTYQEILDEVVARIRVHNPEWTNHNESDPGITILQLFAFMTENLLYRSRLIPERNRLKFLSLLGVPMRPAAAAQGMVAFENLRGPLRSVTLDRDLEVLAGKIPFRTANSLAALPVEGRLYVKAPLPPERERQVREQYDRLFESFKTPGNTLVLYETRQVAFTRTLDLNADTVDGTLWLALLTRDVRLIDATRAAIAGQPLTVGVIPEGGAAGRVLPPGGPRVRSEGATLSFQTPDVGPLPQDPAQRVARYRPLPARSSADVLAEPGLVELRLPGDLPLWDDLEPGELGVGDFPPAVEGEDGDRVVTWIKIRPVRPSSGANAPQATARLAWLGVNAATVRQRATVTREIVARGNGEPDQVYRLAATPVLAETLTLTVDGTPWTQVDDLLAAGPESRIGEAERAPVGYGEAGRIVVRAYTLDRESGTITFGDGLHGARPSAGALIEAGYDHGGGRTGLVAPGAITRGPALPAGVRVVNPVGTWGGDDPASVREGERAIPGFLRHRDRAVTAHDFADIAGETPGVDMGRVEVLPLFLPELPDVATPGAVTVMVIPRYDQAHPDTPEPDGFFLDLVCDHLEPRRTLTTEVRVRGPEYVPVSVSVGFDVMPGRDVAGVRDAVTDRIRHFLSALEGGPAGAGWPLSTNVERLELWAQANRVDGVGKVNDVLLFGPDGPVRDRVELSGLCLPRLAAVAAGPGDPPPMGGEPPAAGPTPLPVPVEPGEC